jgi:glycosyltransferase involved in cell wall biosynthesis
MIHPVHVIIPAYNADRWVAKAVASALDVGIVRSVTVVDDGSLRPLTPDELPSDGRVRLRRQDNAGVSTARNSGMEAVLTSETDDAAWLLFLDADDELLPACVKALRDADGAACCVAARVGVREDDGSIVTLDPPADLSDRHFASPDDAFRYQQVFAGTGMAVRASVARSGVRWDTAMSHGEDIEFLRRVAEHGRVWVSSVPVLRYRLREGDNLSSPRYTAGRVRDFVRTVGRHHGPANDHLFEAQARWLINQASKHAEDPAAYEAMCDLFAARGWVIPLKPRLRHTTRSALGLSL